MTNVGSLLDNWSLVNLMNKHLSKPYNHVIANVFIWLAGFIESWGRGLRISAVHLGQIIY